jgi:membrane protein involved in colicin uptake
MAQRRSVATPAAAAGAGAGNDDVQGAMLEPSVVNTPWVRLQQQSQQAFVLAMHAL